MSIVKIWREDVVIPTYEVGPADKNPMFLEKRVYQGSSGKIYPYPSTNEISRKKKDKIWHAVILENDYIKVMVLPELGGRIQRAYDKTNDYDFVYYNKVIKPALVGLTGPWISGGIEFNWPQHHRPTTYSPVDSKIIENEDGSKSLLTGDVDQMYGTKEITKFTLYPDKAYIEITGQLYNRTPLPQTFLWWANPAVSVNDYTQSIFPPDVHSVYDHGKRAVSRFPIATGEYYKHDYSEGVDISRYKNIPVPTSYMAEKSDYNFVGGYDYQKKAGLLHIADHHISPGKKQWTWGCGDFGKAWDRNLTDEDGPYIELMTGMFCDNQPDFAWLKPYEEKTFKQYFMPYKAVGQVKNATISAALNVELKDNSTLYICVYGTSKFENAKIVVLHKGKEIYIDESTISPVDIYEKEIPLDQNISEYDIKVLVIDGSKELVSYQAKDQGIPKLAEPAKAAKAPEDIMTCEELYLTGQHLEQYRHAVFSPDDYYLEGLKRDPNDIRINNAYGLLLLRRGCFEQSEQYFKRAIERLTNMHPSPYDSEPFYNLGLSYFYQERFDEAFDAFYKASWINELQEMSFYYLAVIASRRRDYEEALDFVEKALIKNAHNIKARGLKAAILIALAKGNAAFNWILKNLELDAFDYVSIMLKCLLQKAAKGENADIESDSDYEEFLTVSRNNPETFLQTARDFAEFGMYGEALITLSLYSGDKPMIHYYKGAYLKKRAGIGIFNSELAETALREFSLGEKCDPTYCFPNKLEDIAVLNLVIEKTEKPAKAYYYLGCLYYDKLQFEYAIDLWKKSVLLDNSFATAHRNLAIALFNKENDKENALKHMERALELDKTDSRVFLELDQLYQKLQKPLTERFEKYQENISLIEKRDDLYTEYVTLLNSLGKYEEAHKLITSHNFQTWEGAEGKISTQFKVSLLQQAKTLLNKDTNRAIALLKEAISYPENLGEGRLEGTKDNHIYYHLGLAYEILAEDKKAKECFEKATLGAQEVAGVMYYYDQPADMILYQGLAFKKLGNIPAANARFYRLLDYGEHHIEDKFKMDYFAVSMPDMSVFDTDMDVKNKAHCYYLMGLGNLGLGLTDKANQYFSKVLELDNTHQNAIIYKS